MIANIQITSLFVLICASYTLGRTFTVVNKCSQTIWPGVFTGDASKGKPGGIAADGGFQLNAGASVTFFVPNEWTAGRIWGRTGCDFSKPDVSACATGSCIGGVKCTQPGIPPVTLAEFTLGVGVDHYDVSNVDGSNLPLSITANGCPTGSCPVDLNAGCPGELQYKDGSGKIVGCYSSCKKLGGESNCCTGAHNTLATCPKSGVKYYDYFKGKCPDAYAYAYDDQNGSLKTCSGQKDFTITFCP